MGKLNPLCLDCKNKCKQKESVIVVGCLRYRQLDKQLELRFTFDHIKEPKNKKHPS